MIHKIIIILSYEMSKEKASNHDDILPDLAYNNYISTIFANIFALLHIFTTRKFSMGIEMVQ